MPTANLGDVQLYYEDSGEGEAVLLSQPSWWPCDTWKINVVPVLSQRYRTIIFDCRGTGFSSKPDHGYTISQFAKDCAGLIEHLKISRVHAAGFALGGQIAQALAIERPRPRCHLDDRGRRGGNEGHQRRAARDAQHR